MPWMCCNVYYKESHVLLGESTGDQYDTTHGASKAEKGFMSWYRHEV